MDAACAEDMLARLRQAGFHCTALELVQELQEAADVPAGMPEVLARHLHWLQDVVEDTADGRGLEPAAPLFEQCLDSCWARHQTAVALQHALNAERATTTALRAQLAEAVHPVPVCEGGDATPLENQRLDALVLQYLRGRGLRLTAVTLCEEMGDMPGAVTRDAPLVSLLRQALAPRELSVAMPSPSQSPSPPRPTRPTLTLHTRTVHHCSIAPLASERSSTRAVVDSPAGTHDDTDTAALAARVTMCLVPIVRTVVTARRLELLPLLHVLLSSCPPDCVSALLDTLPALVRHAGPNTLAPPCAMVTRVAEGRGLDWSLQHLVPWVLTPSVHARGAPSRAGVRLGVACSLLAAASPSRDGALGALGALPLQQVQALGGLLERSVDDAVSPACVTWALGVLAAAWATAAATGTVAGDGGQANRLLLGIVHDVSQAMVLAGAQQQQEDNDSGDDGGGGGGGGGGTAAGAAAARDSAWNAVLWNDVLPHVRTWAAVQGMLWRQVANSWLTVWQEAMSGLPKDRSSDSGDAPSAVHGGAGLHDGLACAPVMVVPAAEEPWLVAAQWFRHSWADVAAAVKGPAEGDLQLGGRATWRAPTPCPCVRTGLDAVLAQAVWFTDGKTCASAAEPWEGVRWLCLQVLPTLVQAAHCASGSAALLRSVAAVMTGLCGAMGSAFTVHVLTPVLYGAACLPKSLLSECCLQVQLPPGELPHACTALGVLVGAEFARFGEPLYMAHWAGVDPTSGAAAGGAASSRRVPTGALVVCALGVWHGGKCMDVGTRRALLRAVCKLPEVATAVARVVAPLMTTAQLGEWLEAMTATRATAPLCVAVFRARAALNPITLESCVLPQVLQALTVAPAPAGADPKLLQAACMAGGRILPLLSLGGQAALLEGWHAAWGRGPTSAVTAVMNGMQVATDQPGARDVLGGLLDQCRHVVDAIVTATKAGNQAMGTISHHIACACD